VLEFHPGSQQRDVVLEVRPGQEGLEYSIE
jgi:hypothetical protein